jgi:hypothetical protein
MDETRRLQMITETVLYCQRVENMGMPSAAYAKALREAIHFVWERRAGGGKEACAQFRSKAAVGVRFGKRLLVYDHAVPFRYLRDELLALTDVTVTSVHEVLKRHCLVVLVIAEEDRRLRKAKLGNRMPDNWDGGDPLARYAAAGIEVVPNH